MDSWDEILDMLKQIYRDQKPKVGGIPICRQLLIQQKKGQKDYISQYGPAKFWFIGSLVQ